MITKIQRVFSLWDCKPGHKRVLLRSPKTEAHADNLDLVFWGVEYLDLPTRFDHFELSQGTESDADKLSSRLGRATSVANIFRITTAAGLYFVVAEGYQLS